MTILEQQFAEFDRANPHVWTLFQTFAEELIAAGHKKLSASLVIERIRWESMMRTRSTDGYKVNNNFRAYYARKWNSHFPFSGAKFTQRMVKGQELLSYEW